MITLAIALHIAVKEGLPEMIKIVLKYIKKEAVTEVVGDGNKNAGCTALHLAVICEDIDAVTILHAHALTYAPELINALYNGCTALEIAENKGYEKLAGVLTT